MASDSGDPPKDGVSGEKKVSDNSDVSRAEIEDRVSKDNILDEGVKHRLEASAKLEHPLAGLTTEQLGQSGEEFCAKHGFTNEEDIRAFRLGAIIAGNMNKYDTVDGLTDREKLVLDRELTHKWSNPTMLYAVIVICSLCAAVQGMDETVVNGAQGFYKKQFGIDDSNSSRSKQLITVLQIKPIALY